MWRPFCTHKAQSVEGCWSLNPSVCLQDMDHVQHACQETQPVSPQLLMQAPPYPLAAESLTLRSLTMLSSWVSTPIYARPNCVGLTMCWGWMVSISQSAYCLVSFLRVRCPLGARRSALRTLWRPLLKDFSIDPDVWGDLALDRVSCKIQWIMVHHVMRANKQAMQ